jgi:hypothetical protein
LSDDDLTPARLRELKRTVRDLDDPRRYVLVSGAVPRLPFYYNVSDDVYAIDLKGATLFKRRKAALAIRAIVRDVRIMEVRVLGDRVTRARERRTPSAHDTKA